MYHTLLAMGCTVDPKKDTVAKVSYWYIPSGYDYVNASCRLMYVPEHALEKVTQYVNDHNYPPEMPMLLKYKVTDKK